MRGEELHRERTRAGGARGKRVWDNEAYKDRKRDEEVRGRFFGFITILSAYILTQLAASYAAEKLIFQFMSEPPGIFFTHVLPTLFGMVLLMGLLKLFMTFFWHDRWTQRAATYNRFTDALEQIAQGNFNVFVDTSDISMPSGLAAAINDMAKNLSNLETMRQDFISNVSHEIQSPLTSISGFAALLKRADLPENERLRYAEIIEAESKRLSSLSENLLKLSTLDNNPIIETEFRLDKQLSNVILTLEPQWSAKHLTVEAVLPKYMICGDEELLSQVWINLLVNAIKFTPENGLVYVSLKENTVKVADTGVGISKNDLPHIFERFYKVDKARDRGLGGNGLGLSLVKKIVELHGGHISVDSETGKGTSFAIFLPGIILNSG
jgi:signal transduction histidine kinase